MLDSNRVNNDMKRIVLALILLLSVSFVLCAISDPYKVQNISGYIDDIAYLYVSPFRYDGIVAEGYDGINLDVTNNGGNTADILNQIKPSTTALSQPGLQIGSFSVLATYTQSTTLSSVKLVITHTKLIHTTDPTKTLEYELAVLYAVGNGTTTGSETRQYCYSSEASSNNKIEINLWQTTKISAIQNGYIYFRRADSTTPPAVGQYQSAVTFLLEAK